MVSPQLIFQDHQLQVVDNMSGLVDNERQPMGLSTETKLTMKVKLICNIIRKFGVVRKYITQY